MGLLDFFRRKALTASPAVLEGLQNRQVSAYPPLGGINYNPSVVGAYQRGLDCTYGWIYRTQPAVRSVVDLIATNMAQLPLKLFERVSDTERKRREDHSAAELLSDPDGRTPADAFIRRLALDYLIWDNAYVLKMRGRTGQLALFRLMPGHVTVYGGRFTPDGYVVWRPDGTGMRVAPENMLHWYGYDPEDPLRGVSKLETLRLELAQDRAIQEALVELAKQNMKGGYIKRPLDSPDAAQDDLDRIAEHWRAGKLKGDPILDEGMEYVQVGITPKDADVIAARQFSKREVADAFGLPMKALMEGDTDARKLLYADVLPPLTKSLACQLDVDILRGEFDEPDFYFEFDLNEKLRGDLESRWQAMTSAAGRSWVTVNEVRALDNRPPLPGGDELAVQANVMLVDGDGNAINPNPNTPQLPAPNVMPPQDPNKPPQDGSYRETPKALVKKIEGGTVSPDNRIRQYQERRKNDIARQRRNISEAQGLFARGYSRLARAANKKAVDWPRYEREFGDDIRKYAFAVGEREGGIYLAHLAGGNFDLDQIRHWLEEMSNGTAEAFTKAFRKDVTELGVSQALERANNLKAALAGASVGTRVTVKIRQEAALQAPGTENRLQYWVADTDRHGDLDGVAVPLGSDWGGIEPGSEPNCQCSVSIA